MKEAVIIITTIKDCTTLSNGIKMPWLGFGVYKVEEGQEVEDSIGYALESGYRSIDTAQFYNNEVGVGNAIKNSQIPRDEIFLTTKVWNDNQGFEETLNAFERSRKKLRVDYLDLYLIHWPATKKFIESWRAMEKLYKEGWIRAIGVSNFHSQHIEKILEIAEIKPMVNQVEFHPKLVQKKLHQYCKANSIQLEAWSPLMRGKIFDHEVIKRIAKKYNKTPAQIVLRWDLQHEVVTIPKSVHKKRIVENSKVFDFKLTNKEIVEIDLLDSNQRVGSNPEKFDNVNGCE